MIVAKPSELQKAKKIRPIGFVTAGGFVKTVKGWRKASKKDIEAAKKKGVYKDTIQGTAAKPKAKVGVKVGGLYAKTAGQRANEAYTRYQMAQDATKRAREIGSGGQVQVQVKAERQAKATWEIAKRTAAKVEAKHKKKTQVGIKPKAAPMTFDQKRKAKADLQARLGGLHPTEKRAVTKLINQGKLTEAKTLLDSKQSAGGKKTKVAIKPKQPAKKTKLSLVQRATGDALLTRAVRLHVINESGKDWARKLVAERKFDEAEAYVSDWEERQEKFDARPKKKPAKKKGFRN